MSLFRKAGLAGIVVLFTATCADAQTMANHHGNMAGAMDPTQMMTDQPTAAGQPTEPGQDAFGTIQEVVAILEADPKADWSKVNIAPLREHLIDMSELTLHAKAVQRDLSKGLEIGVTGEGRTLEAIKRMVPAHAVELNQLGWSATTADLPDGVTLTVTTSEASKLPELKALGFIGIMVLGTHHQAHHLMMAKGEMVH